MYIQEENLNISIPQPMSGRKSEGIKLVYSLLITSRSRGDRRFGYGIQYQFLVLHIC